MENISFVFTGHNIKTVLRKAIRTLLREVPDCINNIVVFDDESSDGTEEFLSDNGIKTITWTEPYKYHTFNPSFRVSSIINEVFKQIKTKYMILLDGDVVFLNGFGNFLHKTLSIIFKEGYDVCGVSDTCGNVNYPVDDRAEKYLTLKRGDGFFRIGHLFLFVDLEKLKNNNIYFDRLDNEDYNKAMLNAFDSSMDFTYQVINNTNIKWNTINLYTLRKYLFHHGGLSTKLSLQENGLSLEQYVDNEENYERHR